MKQRFRGGGMSCAACSAHVEKSVSAVPGVSGVQVNLLAGSMAVEYDENACDAQTIIKAVESGGYTAAVDDGRQTSAPAQSPQADEALKEMKTRIIVSAIFMLVLMYFSMGEMVGLPLPSYAAGMDGMFNLALTELLLTLPIVIINRKYYINGFKTLLHRALEDMEKGMGAYRAVADEDALEFLADVSNGDARSALNAIELGILTTERSADGLIHITLDVASECIQKRVIKYDKNGDSHYDNISAFIKSMRGSDPDAAVYYLAKMLYAGEDVTFIARRIMICASEDVGNADPNALTVAVSAAQAVERLGMPEARIVLAQAATYVASAPKSNAAYLAVDKALSVVRESRTAPVPAYLCDAHYKGAAKLGRGIGYKYAHDYPNHYVKQQYLPDAYKEMKFYEPTENGYEQTIREYFKKIKQE